MCASYTSSMANKFICVFLLFGLLSNDGFCQPKDRSCDLGGGHHVKLIEKENIQTLLSNFVLDIDGIPHPALVSYKGFPDLSVEGDLTFSSCIENIFILAVDSGSVSMPGVAVRFNKKRKLFEKIYFSQKGYPRFILSSDNDFSVYFDYADYDKYDAKYVRVIYKGYDKKISSYQYQYLNDLSEAGLLKIPDL